MIWVFVQFASTILLAAASGVAAWAAGRVCLAPTAGKMASRLRLSLVLICIAGLILLVKLAATVLLAATAGWVFVEDKAAAQLPMLAIPAAAVLLCAYPAAKAIREKIRETAKAPNEPPSPQARLSAAEPFWAFPICLQYIGALLAVIQQFFIAEWPLPIGKILAVWAVFVAWGCLLWIELRSRHRRLAAAGRPEWGTRAARLYRKAGTALAAAAVLAVWFALGAQASRVPDRMSMAGHEHAGGHALHAAAAQSVSVAELTGPRSEMPDRYFYLEAQKTTVTLPSGEQREAWTFNGELPGPELRVKEGELVEVSLFNRDVDAGVTIHWHGIDVPNAEDGVAGLTQDAVMPEQLHIYRFVADEAGTYWYHSHHQSSRQVQMGLYGAIIVEPAEAPAQPPLDLAVMLHDWQTENGTTVTLGGPDRLRRVKAEPGTPVRLRFVNAGNLPASVYISGVPFRVTAIDGADLHEPGDLTGARLELAAGGRYDVTFVMPETAVGVARRGGPFAQDSGALVLSPADEGLPPDAAADSVFDPASYGTPAAAKFGPDTRYDRHYTLVFDNRLGFYNGKFNFVQTINGRVFPDAPMFMVREGELVKMTLANRGFEDHPMHLHGHHIQVLSRNGKAVTGSPWIADTLNVAPGERYEVAFEADNPGIWMDHCHNLDHAAVGMSAHVAYEGYYSPYEIGGATVNQPE